MNGRGGEFVPAPDQRCCGTCEHLRVEALPDGGDDLTCAHMTARGGLDAIGARWWGSACLVWKRATNPSRHGGGMPASAGERRTQMEPKKLGSRVKDTVTGFEGVATGRWESMTGKVRFEVETLDKDGKLRTDWFDDERLQVVA